MTESEEMRLQRMSLVQLPNVTDGNDEIVADDNYVARTELYNKLKGSTLTDKKPFAGSKAAFEIAENLSDRQCVPCNLPVPVLRISGTYPNRLSRTATDKWKHSDELLA